MSRARSSVTTVEQVAQHQTLVFAASPAEKRDSWEEAFEVIATKRPIYALLKQRGVKEAINRPVSRGESMDAAGFAALLMDSGLQRHEIAEAWTNYEVYRKRK